MIVISYNVRGLGSFVKQKDCGDLIRVEKADLCFIQETKLESLSVSICSNWWGVDNCDWAVRNSEGRSGGILCVWNKDLFSVSSKWDFPGAVIIIGVWKPNNLRCCFVNVYAPSDSPAKNVLWERLRSVIEQNKDLCLCMVGDFNAIREPGERVGMGESHGISEMKKFDTFIRECEVIEIRTLGRLFTWYQPNGRCKSKLDRFLVNENWISAWPSTCGRVLQRSLSDHCPILLSTKSVDWGPKPFRFLNAWTSHPDFLQVVKKVWKETKVVGWSCFVFKDKLKRLKQTLKEWNQSSFGNIDHIIRSLKDELLQWDSIDDTFGLEEAEVIRRNEVKALITLQTRNKISVLQQKAGARWLREGDLNSSFYHRFIVGRRKKNEIPGLQLDNRWIAEPAEVKMRVKEHFQNLFKRRKRVLPSLPADFVARKLTTEDKEWLIRPFQEEELKEAIWLCDGSKSPGPDGFNLNFWKTSWEIIKDDLIQVMKDFHKNGKIPRGCNSSFIVLIPKKEEASSIDEFRPILSLVVSIKSLQRSLRVGCKR
ncbi:uncharacterized protein LOC131025575 [Salvia miltiorrhiza]|uniref:uncharacterized protein LOC131025575 n=1 Tax=Salvia miltiorrhiza TaxID=226208 RepID=UPI0025AC9E38|nr:uncharacterized protein LOC131025575 [Salvia miltiorrhiza]